MADRHFPFGDRLAEAIETKTPLCVGIDPSKTLLDHWNLDDSAQSLEIMGRTVVEAVSDHAAAIKPQVAFFERHGSAGYAALERILADAREYGILVIADAKRGDIDTTMAAYGDAWLRDDSPLVVDAFTVTGYLGLAAMESVIAEAMVNGRGFFLVVASSNPEGRAIQTATTSSGSSVEESMLQDLSVLNRRQLEGHGGAMGSFGAVVGATRSAGSLPLESLVGPFLVPGVGAQGATPQDVGRLFEGCAPHSVLVNASRSILNEGPSAAGLTSAAAQLGHELRTALARP